MEWLDKPGRIRPYYEREPEKGKEIWVFFSHEKHVPFFKYLGDAFLKKYEVEIVVLWTLSRSMISIPPEQILMSRSDVFFVDTSFILQDEGFMIGPLANTLSRHRGGYLIFALMRKSLRKLKECSNAMKDGTIDRVNRFQWKERKCSSSQRVQTNPCLI